MDSSSGMLPQATDYTVLSDEELILQLRVGNQEAMTLLYQRLRRLVFSISTRILRDPAEAEDMVQDVFLEIYRKPILFDPSRGNARVWILNYVFKRSLSRRDRLALRRYIQPPAKPNEQERSRIQDQLEIATKALSELHPNQRTVVEHVLFNGFTLPEIAKNLGQPYHTIRNRYYRGCSKLRCVVENLICRKKLLTNRESKAA